MTDINRIKQFYNLGAEHESRRLVKTPIHELEFMLTTEVLHRYIKPESRVLDLGSGPGVYSNYLIKELQCRMSLVDISDEELRIFRENAGEETLCHIDFIRKGSATEINWIPDESFKSILILGSLYHLLGDDERNIVLEQAFRILKPGGIIFCAFISPHSRFVNILNGDGNRIMDDKYLDNLFKGITFHIYNGIEAAQFRCWPGQAAEMIEKSGFAILNSRNQEGVFFYLSPDFFYLLKDYERKKRFIELAKKTCEEPDLLGSTLHFLITAKKI